MFVQSLPLLARVARWSPTQQKSTKADPEHDHKAEHGDCPDENHELIRGSDREHCAAILSGRGH